MKPKHTRGPVHAEAGIHLRCKKRESTTKQRSYKGIGRNSRVGKHHIHIDDVVQALHEDNQDAQADWHTGNNLRYPRDVGSRGPAEPEKTDGQEDGGDHHGYEAFFGDDMAVFGEFAGEAGLRGVDDKTDAEQDTDQNTNEGEGGNAFIFPAAYFAEGDGVGFEEEVEDAVDEGKIDGDTDEDGFYG